MKKFIVLSALLCASLALTACGEGSGNGSGSALSPEDTEAGTFYGIESTEAVYGVAAVTTAKLLSEMGTGANSALAAGSGVLEEAEGFNKYFNMLDSFLEKGETKTVVTANSSSDPAVKDYDFRLTITGKDAAGEDTAHTVYFSESKGEPKTTTRRDEDETTTIESVTYTLTGAVDMGEDEAGNALYSLMSGTRVEQTVTEEEDGEREVERVGSLKLKAYKSEETSAQDYVLLEHTLTSEEEQGETESESVYTYSVYAAGKLTEATEVGFETETEHGETETEYEVKFLSGATRGSYEIERKLVGSKTVIEVEYFLDGERGSFTIERDGENYRYRFSQGGELDLRDFD